LKGRISEDSGVSTAFLFSTGAGATSNAGPTFAEEPSVYLERAFGYAQVVKTAFGRLDLAAGLSDDRYASFHDADTWSGRAAASLTRDWGGQETIVSLAASSGRDVEERLTDAGVVLEHTWTGAKIAPYIKLESSLLDYHDISDPVTPIHNQDDRDRLSSRAQVGLRWTITDEVKLEAGAGGDNKHYLERRDDFGVNRDSVSLFPLIGISYTGGRGSISAVYMPFRRRYKDDLFTDTWKHGYALDARVTLSDNVKAFAGARYGFEETDFLIASAAYESVALAGLVLTLEGGTVTVAAAETRRTYEGLDVIGLSRDDRKLEIALYGEFPLRDSISLTGRIGYMDYASSFGSVVTDELTAGVGLTYVATR
jgi:hypothetical protein